MNPNGDPWQNLLEEIPNLPPFRYITISKTVISRDYIHPISVKMRELN